MVLKMDNRRRITLPKEVVDDPDQKFVAIKTKQGILLKPLPKDPIKALAEEGEKMEGMTMDEIKRDTWEAAREEAGK